MAEECEQDTLDDRVGVIDSRKGRPEIGSPVRYRPAAAAKDLLHIVIAPAIYRVPGSGIKQKAQGNYQAGQSGNFKENIRVPLSSKSLVFHSFSSVVRFS